MLHYFQNSFGHWAMPFGVEWFFPFGIAAIFLLIIWSLVWKGMALWTSARKGEKVWFVIFLVVNTLGILEILYIYVFSKKSKPVI